MEERYIATLREAPLLSAVFHHVRLLDPSVPRDEIVDVVVVEGIIREVRPSTPSHTDDPEDTPRAPGDRYGALPLYRGDGLWLTPCFVDMHVHLREPGEEYKETIASGTRAGAAGGYGALASMPNTHPPNDHPTVTRFIVERAAREGSCRVYPVGAITKGLAGEDLAEMGSLAEAGAVAFSDDGRPVMSAYTMRRAMEYATMLQRPIISHAEDLSLSAGGVMNEGLVSSLLGLKGIPTIAEEVMVARDIMLARWTGARLHVAHVSTKGSVELIRRAKSEGVAVTAETAPHYFTLTEEAVKGFNTVFKVNPPLRTRDDVEAIIHGLADGTIDAIATDHAPHSVIEKDVEFDTAAPGMIGLETALPLTLGLVRQGYLSPIDAIAMLSTKPSRILKLPPPYGSILVGEPAYCTLINPNLEWTVRAHEGYSLSRNCPFEGFTLSGGAEMTIVDGRIVYARRKGMLVL